jgi:hypothetical protein
VPGRGIHLVSAIARQQRETPHRLVCSPFLADIITDSLSQPVVHHWLVHREGSPEILHWGQETTLEEAKRAATSMIAHLAGQEQRQTQTG